MTDRNNLTRRRFLTSLGAGAMLSPALLRAEPARKPLRISFSTLGCPKWSWTEIVAEADRLGFGGIEIRGIQDEMDLTRHPDFQGTRLAGTKRDLDALGLVITDLGASAHMHDKDPRERARQLDEGRRFIDLAARMGVPYVRMFPDKVPEGDTRADTTRRVIDGFTEMAAYAKGSGVVVIMETHGDFTSSAALEAILTGVGSDSFALLWDAHHTFVSGGEAPEFTWGHVGRFVRHVHLKDSIPDGEERRYVLTGRGEVPVEEQVRVLAKAGYQGFYSFEWEKRWHPEIEDPEVAFPHFARTIRKYLADADVAVS